MEKGLLCRNGALTLQQECPDLRATARKSGKFAGLKIGW
jgi:hypothetical protein